jgi:hypothetical protein
MRQTHQVGVGPRGIDDDEIECSLHCADGVHELHQFRRFIIQNLHGLAKLDSAVNRELEVEAGAARPGASVVDVTGEALLATIKVDGSDALAGLQQRNGDM